MNRPVSVCFARPSQYQALLPDLLAILSPDERERATRFRVMADRNRFVVGRGLLRLMVARATGTAAAQVKIRVGPNGRPWLGPSGPSINVSHGGDLVAVALSHQAVGIDVEAVSASPPVEIMPLAFSAAERSAMAPSIDSTRFYRIWTAKEAVLKAAGSGLVDEINQLSVEAGIEGGAFGIDWCGYHYQVSALPAPAGHCASIAVAGGACAITCQTLAPSQVAGWLAQEQVANTGPLALSA